MAPDEKTTILTKAWFELQKEISRSGAEILYAVLNKKQALVQIDLVDGIVKVKVLPVRILK